MKPSDQNAPRRHVHPVARLAPRTALVGGGLLLACAAAHAGMVTDAHGNVGYDSAAECDAAVQAGRLASTRSRAWPTSPAVCQADGPRMA